MASLKKALDQMEEDWENAETRDSVGGYTTYEPGEYNANLISGEVNMSKNDRLQIAWTYRFTEGKYEDKEHMSFDSLDNEVSMSWVKGKLSLLGIDIPKKISDLPETLEEFFKENGEIPVAITIAKDGDYTNTYLNEVTGEAEKPSKNKKGKEEKEEKEEKSDKKKKKADEEELLKELKGMKLKQLLEFADEQDITVPKKIRDDKDDVLDYLKEELGM